jgi:hypothetical protein
MKKILVTEKQAKRLVENVINEQEESNFNKAIQCFLNKLYKANLKIDGYMGDKSKDLLMRFQSERGIYPADGMWGQETQSKLSKSENELLKQCKSQFGDIFDKLSNIF